MKRYAASVLAVPATMITVTALAQPDPNQRSYCNSSSPCGHEECYLVPNGPINNCNCCYAYNGIWKCCPNVACDDCDIAGE